MGQNWPLTRLKNQSAMEYLITYGWSILIIAVILGALAYLGVFNFAYLVPKSQPLSCQVLRPNGPYTSYDINLLGICNNALPTYTAQFNGKNSYIEINNVPQTGKTFTITAWVNEYHISDPRDEIIDAIGAYFNLQYGEGCLWVINSNGYLCSKQPVSNGQWAFLAAVFVPGSPGSETIYVDGEVGNTITKNMGGPSGVMSGAIGTCWYCGSGYGEFNGMISNVQIYNASLDQNSIIDLYQEGIGGVPIDLQNLQDWWPLNGNANDYSGNGNNGVPANMAYTSSWISSYNPP